MPLRTPASVTISDKPNGARGQTFERRSGGTAASLTSGRLALTSVYLPAGETVSAITFYSSATGVTTPTNSWAALYTQAGALVAQTPDDPAIVWAANTAHTFTFGTPQTVSAAGWYYFGLMVAATTPPGVACIAPSSAMGLATPAIGGLANTGLASTAPATATTPVSTAVVPYASYS